MYTKKEYEKAVKRAIWFWVLLIIIISVPLYDTISASGNAADRALAVPGIIGWYVFGALVTGVLVGILRSLGGAK